MGLDIRMNVEWAELEQQIKDQQRYAQGPDAKRIADDLEHFFRISTAMQRVGSAKIQTRPGSYHGVHCIRCLYAKLKGWPVEKNETVLMEGDCPARTSHLINHSDCEDFYVPAKFAAPIWHEGTSIGSSQRLLDELREIEHVEKDENQQWAWDALYIAALASVTCHACIHFE
jgi:hypothetical protein